MIDRSKIKQHLVNDTDNQVQACLFNKLNQDVYLNSFLNTADNVGFVITDLGGRYSKIKGFSRGAEKLFQYKSEEIMGQNVSVLHLREDVKGFYEMQNKLSQDLKGFSGTTKL